jgi:hypothetical protein
MAEAGGPPSLEALLTALIAEACREVLPPELSGVLHASKAAVRPCATLASADFECRAPRAAFSRLRAMPRFCAEGGAVAYTTTSALGLERSWRFNDAVELAAALAARLPESAAAIVVDARASSSGLLQLTTRQHLQWQLAEGQLRCAACGLFCAGERGLRDHQLVKHRTSYEAAVESARDSRTALVAWTPPPRTALPAMALAQRAAATARREGRSTLKLHAGLRAARDGDLACLRALVAGGWDARRERDRHGSSAMLWAAGGGHLGCCRWLAACGMDPLEGQRTDGRCALHWAARNGHVDVCRWLLAECGERPDRPTHDGTVALHWAVWQRQLAACALLVDEAGADLHATNSFGCNAIQWAAQSGDVRVCEWLRARGLDLRLLNSNGHSALHKAALNGHGEVCEWLLAHAGLDARHMQTDSDGNSPARMAAAEGHAELARHLEAVAGRWEAEAAAAGRDDSIVASAVLPDEPSRE